MSTPKTTYAYWRDLARTRQWIIRILENRIDALEEELQQLQEGKTA